MTGTNRILKFRAWDEKKKVMHFDFQFFTSGEGSNDWICFSSDKEKPDTTNEAGIIFNNPYCRQQLKIMQWTGLKAENGLQEIYERDIIDGYGNIKGNTCEMNAGESDFIIQGFGDKNWGSTCEEAVRRGCKTL